MGDTLSIQNNLLLIRNSLLTQCCCTSNETYWEAVPCEWHVEPDDGCATYQGCSVGRKYVSNRAICEGDTYICECQKLTVPGWSGLTDVNGSAFTWNLLSDYSRATGVFSSTGCTFTVRYDPTLTIYTGHFPYSNYSTLQGFIDGVNAYAPGGPTAFILVNNYVHPSSVLDSVKHATYSQLAPGSQDLSNEPAGLFITWSGQTSPLINYVNNGTLFNTLIQSRLRTIIGLEDITSTADYNNLSLSDYFFYITFAGSQCGIAQDNLSLSYRWVGSAGQPTAPFLSYGEYVTGWGQEGTNYVLVPSGEITCPYEDASVGYRAFTKEAPQCCPQKGTHLGTTQVLGTLSNYGSEFENLENTIIIDDGSDLDRVGSCFKLTPFAFIFGKEGKFYDDPTKIGSTFIKADCNYTASGCTYQVPSNGQLELFIPRFSDEVPWGPFGSYFYQIYDTIHPAYQALLNGTITAGQNYPADNFFRGYHYAPSGNIRTFGSWTATTGIQLVFQFNSYEPFWVGTTSPAFQNRRLGKINTGTLSSAFTVASGNNCSGVTILNYNCSGKTVADFITDVNKIQTLSVSGQSCYVFNFCPGADMTSLAGIPCSKINNLSAELYDVWKQNAGYDSTYLIQDPQWDKSCYGGSTIWPYPVSWPKMLADSAAVGNRPNAYSGASFAPAAFIVNPPPASRHNVYPKQSSYNFQVRYNCRPYWVSMAGHEETVATLVKGTSNFDPDALQLNISIATGILRITVSSGVTTLYSSGINTIKNGSGYTQANFVDEINAVRYPWFTNPLQLYQPVVATSGNPGYPIYIDDTTWADAATVSYTGSRNTTEPGIGVRTVPNFGYQEPIIAQGTTDIFPTDSSLAVKSWVRERVLTSDITECFDGLPRNLIPWGVATVDPPTRINCEGDNIEEENWLLTYGCNSYRCKVEWFIQAQRCGCDTVPACSENGPPVYEANQYNLPTYTDCENLVTPTFYMCEQNLHPDCDIPFLVKVPQMFICYSGRTDCYFNFNGDSCWLDPDAVGPCNFISRCPASTGDLDPIQVGYLTATHGCQSNMDINTLRCWMNKPYDGWCQYIDPENLQKVRRQDIPLTWPPEALVMEKATQQFCTRNINLFDDDTGVETNSCGDPFVGTAPYDALTPLWPAVPAEFITPVGETNAGWPCFLNEFITNELFAYIRPIVKNFDASGLCGTTACLRVAIDCNTRCCRCGYSCNTESTDCYTGPKRNCQQTSSVTYTYEETGPDGCCFVSPFDPATPGACNFGGGCSCPPLDGGSSPALYPPVSNCYDANHSTSITVNFEETNSTSLVLGYTRPDGINCSEALYNPGCCWNALGDSTTIYDRGGTCSSTCWYDCCGTKPASGCPNTQTCDYTTIGSFDCSNSVLSYAPSFTTSSSGYIGGTLDCTDPCDGEFPDRNCDAIELQFYENFQIQNYLDTRTTCGVGTIVWDRRFEQKLDGMSTESDCGAGSVELGIKFGPGASAHSCTCASWAGDFVYQGAGLIIIEEGTITIESKTCDSCNFDDVVGNTDYNYIVTKQLGWTCGSANEIQISTGSFTDANICP